MTRLADFKPIREALRHDHLNLCQRLAGDSKIKRFGSASLKQRRIRCMAICGRSPDLPSAHGSVDSRIQGCLSVLIRCTKQKSHQFSDLHRHKEA
jgi:hypothetical protein